MSGSDTSGLFDPEAFEQIPGQISMEQVEPSFASRFPDQTHYIDGLELRTFETGAVMWCSDWARIWDLPLRREYGGPATYGHVTFYVDRAS